MSQSLFIDAPTINHNQSWDTLQTIQDNSLVSTKVDPKIVAENILVDKMAVCESTDNPLAVNLVDRDGTSSFGRFQFKPQTLKYYAEKYNLADISAWEKEDIMNWIYDGNFQEQIFRKMLYDKDIIWKQEFPTCFRRYYNLFLELWILELWK